MDLSWLTNVVPPPETRVKFTPYTWARDLFPSLALYFIYAYLVQLPNTRHLRLGLLPMSLWAAYHGATRIDLTIGIDEVGFAYLNQGLVINQTFQAMRILTWAFAKKPYQRLHHSHIPSAALKQNEQSNGHSYPKHTPNLLWDTFDLAFNYRGLGWNWSRGLHVPRENRPTQSKPLFVLYTSGLLVLHLTLWDLFHYFCQSFSPSTLGSSNGGTVYDYTLPPLQRYARSSFLMLLAGLTVYNALEAVYHICALIGLVLLAQYPSQWPPNFDAPWFATSLAELWARRWHQIFRDSFISVGAYPLSLVLGRTGSALGAFFVSGLLHYIGLWGMGSGSDFKGMCGFFMMMGIGLILEELWKKVMAKCVTTNGVQSINVGETVNGHGGNGHLPQRHASGIGGVWGWMWTVAWVIGWAHLLVDAWARKGLVGSVFISEPLRPSTLLFGPLDYSS